MSKYMLYSYHFAHVQTHSFHMVYESPWPLIGACTALLLTVGGVWAMHWGDASLLFFAFILLGFVFFVWWSDVIVEALYLGYHTKRVVSGLKMGMILFIASEVMFFFSFFWAFFHGSLSPSIVFGTIWPPKGIPVLNPLELPLLNTIILLSSGLTVTWAHFCVASQSSFFIDLVDWMSYLRLTDGWFSFVVTLLLALEFTCCQAYEYYEALFYINDGIYGSTFYVATGFHGLHVIIGTMFLTMALVSLMLEHFSLTHHVGFEMAIWYWHFVDVVWLVLYVFMYCWSGGSAAMHK